MAQNAARINLNSASIQNGDSRGVRASRGSFVNLDSATVSENALDDMYLDRGSIVQSDSCVTSSSASDGPHASDVERIADFNSTEPERIVFAENTETA